MCVCACVFPNDEKQSLTALIVLHVRLPRRSLWPGLCLHPPLLELLELLESGKWQNQLLDQRFSSDCFLSQMLL